MGLLSIDSKVANQRFFQQNLQHCVPISHPGIVIIVLSIFGGFLVILGGYFYQQGLSLAYIELTHENSIIPKIQQVTLPNLNLESPVHIYYRVPGFFQNVRSYVQSFDEGQLKQKSSMLKSDLNKDCKAPSATDRIVPYPCGLQFHTMNLDSYQIQYQNGTDIPLNRSLIVFPGDIKQNTLFGQAFKNYDYAAHFGVPSMTWQDVANWMRPSAFAAAQKYYGAFQTSVAELQIISNGSHTDGTDVFSESRVIILAQMSALGGRKETMMTSIVCMVTGCISAASALVFAIIAAIKGPRSSKYNTAIDKLKVITGASLQLEEFMANEVDGVSKGLQAKQAVGLK